MAGEKAEKIKEYVGVVGGVGRSGGSVAAQAVSQENEEFAGVAFVVGEGNWWSGKEKLKKHKSPRSQEISRVVGFFSCGVKKGEKTPKRRKGRKVKSD